MNDEHWVVFDDIGTLTPEQRKHVAEWFASCSDRISYGGTPVNDERDDLLNTTAFVPKSETAEGRHARLKNHPASPSDGPFIEDNHWSTVPVVRPCRECGDTNSTAYQVKASLIRSAGWGVVCDTCGHWVSPIYRTMRGAILIWNKQTEAEPNPK